MDGKMRTRAGPEPRILLGPEVPTIYLSVFFRNAIVRAQASAASAGL